jgi:hypothetical protein
METQHPMEEMARPQPDDQVRRSDLARALRQQVGLVESALAALDSHPGDNSLVDGLLVLIDRTASSAESTGFPSVAQAVRDVGTTAKQAL